MQVKYKENRLINHNEIQIVFHPVNRNEVHLLVRKMKKQLDEIEVYDECYNHYNISVVSIYYIETMDHKVFVYTREKTFRAKRNIKQLKEKLKSDNFVQINARTLVNKNHIMGYKIEKNSRRSLTLDNNEVLIVNRSYKDKI